MGSYTHLKSPNGTIYVYWQESCWDKEKQMSVPKKTCVGKLGKDGEIIYNKQFASPLSQKNLEQGVCEVDVVSVGQTMVLDAALEKCGLSPVLAKIFGSEKTACIISLAYAIIATDSRMYGAESWMESHACPCHDRPLSSPRVSEMFASLSPSEIESFLCAWMGRLTDVDSGHYCFDVTSVSSTNEDNPFVEWGYNRDKERLPQINMALLSGMSSRLPAFYQMMPGSVSDVTCIRELDERFAKYGVKGMRLVLDRGFYSARNLEDIAAAKCYFMIPLPGGTDIAHDMIDRCRSDIESDLNFIELSEDHTAAVYGMTQLGKVSGKRVWYHVYFDTARRVEHISSFFAKLAAWEIELKTSKLKKAHLKYYDKYFHVKTTPKRGYQVRRNMEAVNEYKADYAGYWVIVTNFERNAKEALSLYRLRARVEQHYDDLKNELDMMRLRTHRQETMTGRIFVHFVALILLQQLRIIMADTGICAGKLTVRSMMKMLDPYQKIHFAGKYRDVYSTMTKSQREIFKAFSLIDA